MIVLPLYIVFVLVVLIVTGFFLLIVLVSYLVTLRNMLKAVGALEKLSTQQVLRLSSRRLTWIIITVAWSLVLYVCALLSVETGYGLKFFSLVGVFALVSFAWFLFMTYVGARKTMELENLNRRLAYQDRKQFKTRRVRLEDIL